jgi:hypothetical protein
LNIEGITGVYLLTPMESNEHRMIESLAYYFYLADGRPEGKALQHWLEAEQLLETEQQCEVESFELNFLEDKAVEEREMSGLFVETRCF